MEAVEDGGGQLLVSQGGGGGGYPSLSEALLEAKPGDTIYVTGGVYESEELIKVELSVEIIGVLLILTLTLHLTITLTITLLVGLPAPRMENSPDPTIIGRIKIAAGA